MSIILPCKLNCLIIQRWTDHWYNMGCNDYIDVIINILQAQIYNVKSLKVVVIRSKCLDTQSLSCYWFQPWSLLKLLSDIRLLTSIVLLCVWKYVDITLRSTAVVSSLHAFLTTQRHLKLIKVTAHKFIVALTSPSLIVPKCHCVETVQVRRSLGRGDSYLLWWCCHLHHLHMHICQLSRIQSQSSALPYGWPKLPDKEKLGSNAHKIYGQMFQNSKIIWFLMLVLRFWLHFLAWCTLSLQTKRRKFLLCYSYISGGLTDRQIHVFPAKLLVVGRGSNSKNFPRGVALASSVGGDAGADLCICNS